MDGTLIADPARVVRDGRYSSEGSATAGIDSALTLASEFVGEAGAQAIRFNLGNTPNRPSMHQALTRHLLKLLSRRSPRQAQMMSGRPSWPGRQSGLIRPDKAYAGLYAEERSSSYTSEGHDPQFPFHKRERIIMHNLLQRRAASIGYAPVGVERRLLLAAGVLGVGTAAAMPAVAAGPSLITQVPTMRHGRIPANGMDVFYREAGSLDAPVLLLLHGFANSSFYFRHLMSRLAHRFRLIAPDLPSFGFTELSGECDEHYDFNFLSRTIGAFSEAMGLQRYILYVFDYGAPVGFDLALTYPDRVVGIISQNGNAYLDGLSEGAWAPLRAYWTQPSDGPRKAIGSRMSLEGVKAAYVHGVPNPSLIEPESYTLDAAILAQPGNAKRQIDLKLDYKRNIDRYPLYQEYFRRYQPKMLAVWGCNDLFFIPAGAKAFKRDMPNARVVLLNTGHFALETDMEPIAAEIERFF